MGGVHCLSRGVCDRAEANDAVRCQCKTARGPLTSHCPVMYEEEVQLEADGEECSCLYWSLVDDAKLLKAERLLALHDGILDCAKLVAARMVEAAATHGLLVCSASIAKEEHFDRGHMSLEDIIVRLGQLICRWAISQEPPYALHIGVHSGIVRKLVLRSGGEAVYGEAVSEAKRLADLAPQDSCVQILKSTKDKLNVLERLPFTCSRVNDCYYLEPSAELPEEAPPSAGYESLSPTSGGKHCTAEFRQMLVDHGIDISKFGKGQAKTLDELYRNVEVEKKSYFVKKNDSLERRMELVNISLTVTGQDGHDMELRLNCEVLKDSTLVRRNQRPSSFIEEGSSWKSAVDAFFASRLGLPAEIRQELLAQDNVVTDKVERIKSMFFPGVETMYTTYDVCIHIPDPTRPSLRAIGLPDMTSFDTEAIPVANLPKANWSWRRRGEELSNEEALERLLQEHGIDTNDYPPGATAELCDELYESRYATLNIRAGHLVRNIQIIKVWLCATILSVDYVLRSKGKMQFGKRERNHKEGPVTMRMRSDQDWKAAALACLYGKLGMDEAFVKSHLVIVDSSYRLDEEVEYSRSYPGLKTVYNIHTVKCRVKDVDNPEMSFIGLPEGNDFAVTRVRQSLRPSKTGREGVVSTLWFWKPRNQLTETGDLLYFQKSFTNDQHKDLDTEDCTPVAKRQLDLPMALEVTIPDEDGDEYRLVVAELMKGRTTNWSRARRAAKRMLDPTYSLKSFYDDCLASFPELLLYGADDGGLVSSGRSCMEEYQRTMGALFAVFWFMRRKMGGAESFCFGVDDEWEPLNARSKQARRKKEEIAKRQTFFNEVEWERIDELLHDAGLLCDGVQGHDEERVLAMLVLTAIHDIMKLVPLLPTVAPDHAPYRGYKVGETIHDHDIALSYVLDHYSYALPSYHELSKKQQDSIRFTQCKMEYNMGWLVQAEAPPGALFTKFKECMEDGSVEPADVAFYFCHWLTDLAGAEPYPQEGCEKFVLKFPRTVLSSFIKSFKIVGELAVKSESQVLEDYLVWRWTSHQPSLGVVPGDRGSIAALRLVVMAQGDSQAILRALTTVPLQDRDVLEDELAHTGCKEQLFELENFLEGTVPMGPAILIYYAPALMQKAGKSDPSSAMRILAEIFRQARQLWPMLPSSAGTVVTVRIDVLKELEVKLITAATPGEVWALEKTSSRDAEVKKVSLGSEALSQAFLAGNKVRMLNFTKMPYNNSIAMKGIQTTWRKKESKSQNLDDFAIDSTRSASLMVRGSPLRADSMEGFPASTTALDGTRRWTLEVSRSTTYTVLE